MNNKSLIKGSRSAFCINPLYFDEQLKCASFNVRLGVMTPELTHELDIQKLFDTYPGLRKHRCESGRHRSFFDEARQTETVHLLEHVAVELLAISGVSRDKARGQTGISQGEKRNFYRLRLYGADSLGQADVFLREAAIVLDDLLL